VTGATLAPGVWGILATPFDDDLRVDEPSLERLVELYRQAGAAGVVALGVLGEAARLDSSERRRVVERVSACGLPVVAGVSSLATAPAVEEAVLATEAGASAVMVLVSTPDADALAAHLAAVSRACGAPVVVQDHPATTGVSIAADALRVAVAACGVAAAIKEEAPPTAPAVARLAADCQVPVFGGLGGVNLLDELVAGSAGAMTGFAVPEALVATVEAFDRGGYGAARAAYLPWLPLVLFEAQQPGGVALRKEILRRRGVIATARVRAPGAGFPSALAAVLDAHLSAVDLPVPVGGRA
jgi:4-hydroxy-tetrahydrodipicolinate synthase